VRIDTMPIYAYVVRIIILRLATNYVLILITLEKIQFKTSK